jgi:hexosaminidase
MTNKYFKFQVLVFTILFSVSGMGLKAADHPVNIIPVPSSMKILKGEFTITAKTNVVVFPSNPEVLAVASFFANRIDSVAGFVIKPKASEGLKTVPKNTILFSITNDVSLGEEGYHLTVEKDQVLISANTAKGLFYGVQSMFQLLPPKIMSPIKIEGIILKMQAVKISDKPRFGYRGMMLDVGRHFMPVSFVKQYIDLLAMFKLNTFHWHLTEDQGWRIEIKKYPKLAQISSMRDETIVGHAGGSNKTYDGIPHGGYYTQDQIKDVVDYASKRFVTIIPEIEMPGHSQAVLAAYPQLSCTGGPFKVATNFGVVTDILCAGNDSTYIFLQDVLDEVMALFPSKYIHIGGDEAPKARWHDCPKCQALLKAQGLKDEHELQSYFIKRMEKYVLSKGHRIIGWDEILEGGLAPEATVMSWRGVAGGITAAKEKHDVIMSSNSHLYFDYYQADPETEPLAIGGYLTLKKVYGFEPIPAELTPEEAKHIIGAQGQIWTEYMKTPNSVQYMMLPRLFALAEIDWSSKEQRNWDDFRNRLDNSIQRMVVMGLNYSQGNAKVDVSATAGKDGKYLILNLEAERPNMIVHYNLDGNPVTPGSAVALEPIKVKKSSKLYSAAFVEGQMKDKMISRIVEPHLAAYTEAMFTRNDKPDFKPVSMPGLVDGFCGAADSDQATWNAIQGKDDQITIDLKQIVSPKEIAIHCMSVKDKDIVMPTTVEFQISQDNKEYTSVKILKNDSSDEFNTTIVKRFSTEVLSLKARYVRVIIKAESKTARDPRLLVDEVVVK